MKLLVTRHGETPWNRENWVLGRTDIPLNETGRAQALTLRERLEGRHIDAVYVSPLSRTMETASIALEGRDLALVPEPRIIEMNFGDYEKAGRRDPEYNAVKRCYFRRLPGGGESVMDLAARIYPYIRELARKHRGETVLLVTHGGIARVIRSYFTGMDNEEFSSFFLENCGLLEYDVPEED